MINLKSLKIEYLICAIFGILALLLSLIAGVFSGNSVGFVFQRAFITAIMFSIIGFACVFIIKKCVPEVYQIISTIYNTEGVEIKAENSVDKDNKVNKLDEETEQKSDIPDSSEADNIKINREDAELENAFNTLDKQPGENYSINTQQNDGNLQPKVVFKDKKIKYEPKIAAQAIRTMMKRDE